MAVLLAIAPLGRPEGLAFLLPGAIALAAGLKVFPALLVPYFLFRRDWRAVGVAVDSLANS